MNLDPAALEDRASANCHAMADPLVEEAVSRILKQGDNLRHTGLLN